MNKHYDVIIVGAGIAGIMAAYELAEKADLNVLLLEQGKNIYAIPSRITDYPGTNSLIQQGAKLILDIEDILEEEYCS